MPKGVYDHTHIVPKVFPPGMVARVADLYADGRTQIEIARTVGCTQKVIWRLMRNHGIAARVAAKRFQSGSANDSWRGDQATYEALHTRVEVARGKPRRCGRCGTADAGRRYEWANLTGNYLDVADYERMCVPCHRRYDADRRAATGHPTTPDRRVRP